MLAVVVPHYGQSTETFIRRYCLELCPEQTVLVHFYHGAGQWQINGPVYCLPQATFGSIRVWQLFRGFQKVCGIQSFFGDPFTSHSLATFLQKHKVTCVFSQYLVAGWNVHATVKRLGLRHVVRGHGFDVSADLNDPQKCRRYRQLSDADAIVVPSPFQVERLRRIGLHGPNIISVPYGVDLPADTGLKLQRIESPGAPLQVLAVGRMVAKKAPLLSVKAFLEAAASYPEMTLTFIGTGPLEPLVRDYINRHDKSGRIHLLGARSHAEVLKAMSSADIFMQHSVTDPDSGDQEGAPVAILEAMAYGIPIVSTRHSGIPYLVEHEKCGLLCEEGDIALMASSLVRLARSVDLRRSMGFAARKRAEALSWQQERQALFNLLFPQSN